MDRSLFKFILRYSSRQQLFLLGVIALSYPLNFLLYDIPKAIINRAIGGDGPPFSAKFFGLEFSFDVGQIAFLILLCVGFLSIVIVNNGVKYFINVYKGRLAERLLRRLRYQLYARVLRFPLPHFKRVSQGELISMITAEAEQVGNFTSGAIADPAFLGGQLVVAIGFILIQDPLLGAAALAFYPVQMYVVPKLQKRVSALAKQRLREVRRLSDHIGESVTGVAEVHANDTTQYELSRFANRLGILYKIRYEWYLRKYVIKFLNNLIDKLAPFFFYFVGGILVINGSLTLGALVAVLAAHKDMASPWKELLTWYQQREDARVKYDQIVSQFDPANMLDESLQQEAEPATIEPLAGTLELANVSLVDEDEVRRLASLSFTLGLDRHAAVIGDANSGKDTLAQVLARLALPTNGKALIGGRDLAQLPEAVTGRRLAYVGQGVVLQADTVRANLLYGLKHRPRREAHYDETQQSELADIVLEATRSGNTKLDFHADWVDLDTMQADSPASVGAILTHVLGVVGLADDVYQMGLRGSIDPAERPDIADSVLQARRALRDRLAQPEYTHLIEPFDRDRYNTNASVAENLLFGNPINDMFDMDRLAENPYVLSVLDKAGLSADWLDMGRQVAQTMVEIFADLPPGHDFFEQYSFISSDDLPEFQTLLARAERGTGLSALDAADRTSLMSLPFKIIPAQHRLGLIDDAMQERLLRARQVFADELPADLVDAVEFFDAERYNAAASLQDNILFGKPAYGQAQAAQTIGAMIAEMLEELDLRRSVMEAGLGFHVGVGGARLSGGQRQRLAFARALLKKPDLMIVNEAASVLDATNQTQLIDNLLAERRGQGVVWMLANEHLADKFDEVLVLRDGRLAEQRSTKQAA